MDCTVTDAKTPTECADQLSQFVACVFELTDIVEIRRLKPIPGTNDSEAESNWYLASELASKANGLLSLNAGGWNIYIGANPRPRNGAKGNDCIQIARTLFVDFDGGIDTAEALERVANAKLPTPTLVVHSGGGVHLYWRLIEPLTDRAAWSQLQQGLIAVLNSDKSIHNAERIMRLPGFLNVKAKYNPPPPCYIVEADSTRRYDVAELTREVPRQEQNYAPRTEYTGPHADLLDTLRKYGADVLGEGTTSDGHNGYCVRCPREASHTTSNGKKDCMVWELPDGKWAAKCFHASCGIDSWQAFKTALDPDWVPMVSVAVGNGNMLVKPKASLAPEDYTAAADDCLELIANETTTDAANGRRLVKRSGNQIRYVTSWQKWLVWDGKRWALDNGPRIEAMAKAVADTLWVQYRALNELFKQQQGGADNTVILECLDPDKKPSADQADDGFVIDEKMLRAAAGFCHYTSGKNGINNMVIMARSEPGIAIDHHQLDTDGWLLNVENGTLDLRNGNLLPHESSRLLTKLAPVVYDTSADCPLWRNVVATAMAHNQELIEFTRRLLGMSCAGVVRDHVLPFWYGSGANGKSTMVEAMFRVLGWDYSMKAPDGLLLAKDGDSHPTERADLFGKRLVVCNEVAQGRRLNEALIKDLTGNDTITARRMREDFWSFEPSHTLIMFGNHKPAVRGTDNGIWRRLKLVPFDVVIALEDQDPELGEKLAAEASGILNWLLIGCMNWQREGLQSPEAVEAATSQYRSEEDVLGEFINERCLVDATVKVKGGELYTAFKGWQESRGERAWGAKAFSGELCQRFDRHRNNGTWYLGIGLKVDSWSETE